MEAFFPETGYKTPSNVKRSLFANFLWPRTIIFYTKIFLITIRASMLARKGKYDSDEWARNSRKIITYAEYCGAEVSIQGLNNIISTPGPVVVIGNHMSVLETYMLACILMPHKKPAFIVKKELRDYPVFGEIMRSVAHIAISRKNPKEDFKEVMEQGTVLISQGYSPIVFPQATRMREFLPEHFNTIGVKLAKQASVPIIPLALKTDFWGTGKILKDFGPIGKYGKRVFFEFGPPLKVTGNGKEEHEKIITFIKTKLAGWKE